MRRGRFDSVAKPAECLDHFSSALLLGRFLDAWASFLISDSPVQHLPDQAAKFVSNYSDGLIVAHARHVAAIESLEACSGSEYIGLGSSIASSISAAPADVYINSDRFL